MGSVASWIVLRDWSKKELDSTYLNVVKDSSMSNAVLVSATSRLLVMAFLAI